MHDEKRRRAHLDGSSWLSLSPASPAAGCASSGAPAKTAGTESKRAASRAARRRQRRQASASAGAEQLIPKEKKRAISDDARADFEKAMERYQAARKGGMLRSASARASRARSSKSRTTARRWSRRASIRAPCCRSAGTKTTRSASGRGCPSTARPSPTSATWPGATATPARAESLFNRAVEVDPLHTIEARNNLAQISARQGPPRLVGRREEGLRRPGRQPPAHRAGARQQQPAGVLDAGVHLLRHEHAGDGQAGRQPGHQEGATRSRPASSTRRRPRRPAATRAARRARREARRPTPPRTTTAKLAKEVNVRRGRHRLHGRHEEEPGRWSTTPWAWSS